MKKSTKEIFRRLEAQKKAKHFFDPLELLFPKKSSIHLKNTVGYFADQLSLPVELLIDQFEAAGIGGLTPAHKIHESHKSKLLNYLRKTHSSKPENINNVTLLYEQKVVGPQCIALLEDVNEELLRMISRSPDLVYKLAPRKFEELIARLFADRGYEVSLTKATRDGGYDLLAKWSDGMATSVVFAECKRYEKNIKVGVDVVRGLYGVTEMHGANQGLVITSSYFTKDAIEEQLRIGNRIGLRDFNNLVDWLKPYST
ncbi:MAG TPA: restriction endonuclease [Gallionella sp.]|nr:restriction endonuclease [Gallionella sp.]